MLIALDETDMCANPLTKDMMFDDDSDDDLVDM